MEQKAGISLGRLPYHRFGKLLLVAVDGRRTGWSVGASFRESALTMRSRRSRCGQS